MKISSEYKSNIEKNPEMKSEILLLTVSFYFDNCIFG